MNDARLYRGATGEERGALCALWPELTDRLTLRGELNAIRAMLPGDRAQQYQLAERAAEPERKAG